MVVTFTFCLESLSKCGFDYFFQYLAFGSNLTHVVLRAIEIANGVDEVSTVLYVYIKGCKASA